jgi:hypothetical protein
MVNWTAEQREQIGAMAAGKTVRSLEWSEPDRNSPFDEIGPYWVMTFTDETELCFRLMSELVTPD